MVVHQEPLANTEHSAMLCLFIKSKSYDMISVLNGTEINNGEF